MPTDHAELLRDANLRVTAPRLAVLAELAERPHATADVIRTAVHERLGTVSTQAVYDVLNALTGARILRRIEPEGSAGRYEIARGDNHHHLVCRSCGEVRDIACAVGHAPCLTPDEDHGYVVDTAEVIFWGTCADCSQPAAPGEHPGTAASAR